ncbi:MAG: CoA-binding protein, partial [Nitrososphaeria archaeon]|nr:CoA-binding protein [Nitrososphaeria archaeon]NIQ33465.1 CoA-binding protein [Nitrososphaeria archaeon]
MNSGSLSTLFSPRTIALVGASRKPGRIGYEILRNLRADFRGKVYPINPGVEEVQGLRAYKSISEVPEPLDLVVFAVTPRDTLKAFMIAVEKRVGAAIIVSGGFKELGGEGEEIEGKIRRIARESGVRVIGPNCIGVLVPRHGVDTFFQSRGRMDRPRHGQLAILSQSGTYAATMTEWAVRSHIGVSKVVSYGNRVDVDEADLIEFLADDPDTAVIALYVEGVEEGRKLYEEVKKTSFKKPVIVYKGGKSGGAETAILHTGWLAGDYPVFHFAMRQAGAIEVENTYGLIDAAKALIMIGPIERGGVVSVTNGAGPVVVGYDLLERYGLHTSTLSEQTTAFLKEMLPSYCQVSNPVDLTGSADSGFFDTALGALTEDINIDLIFAFLVLQDTPLDEG